MSDLEDTTKPVSLANWKKSALHLPLLPSGSRVEIKIPDLAAMIEGGEIPQHLLEAALELISVNEQPNKPEPTMDERLAMIRRNKEFMDHMVVHTVTNPVITPEVLPSLPQEDKEMLVLWATRQIDWDAEGEHIAGLSKSEKFRRFRKLGEFNETLADV